MKARPLRQVAQAVVRRSFVAAVPSVGRASPLDRPLVATADATRRLYERFGGQIFGYCLHQLRSREEAEDAVQTTFLNAFRGLQRGIVPEVESAWLFKIAHNVCLSRRRSSRRRGRVEAPNNMEVLQEIVPARERGNEELIRLQDALAAMPESQRRAILLREWQGLSYGEIADELDVSRSAVETLIFRARRTLAAGLEEAAAAERKWKKRTRSSLDAGGLAAALKTLLSGGTAIKTAATIAAVATTAVAVSSETEHHLLRAPTKAHAVPPRTTHHASPSAPAHRLFTVSRARSAAAPLRRRLRRRAVDRHVHAVRLHPAVARAHAAGTRADVAHAAVPPPTAPAPAERAPAAPNAGGPAKPKHRAQVPSAAPKPSHDDGTETNTVTAPSRHPQSPAAADESPAAANDSQQQKSPEDAPAPPDEPKGEKTNNGNGHA